MTRAALSARAVADHDGLQRRHHRALRWPERDAQRATNALAAKAIYDRAGIGAWYGTRYMTAPNLHYQGAQRGGHLSFAGLFDRGGDFVTNGPTAFVAGEGPRHRRERVRITPAHARGGEGVNVTIEAGAVVVQAGGGGLDSAAAEQIGQRVVRKIIEAIDRAKGSGEL
jgi:hypothetical protein